MKRKIIGHRRLAASAIAVFALQASALAADPGSPPPPGNADDDAFLRKQAQDYAAAFSSGNAAALTAMWAPDGTLTDVRGEEFHGRDEISKTYSDFFSRFGPQKLEVKVESIRFPSSDVAIEDGICKLVDAPTPIHAAHYQVVHVKKDGKWSMVSGTETPYSPRDNSEFLNELSWIVGDWKAQGPAGSMRFVANWIANKNFISCAWYANDSQQPTQMEIIGWDPSVDQIASWHFDRSGGFGYAAWSKDKNNWIVNAHAVQPGGQTGTAEYLFKKVDNDNFTWRSERRALDGVPMPGTAEIKISRTK